MAAAPWKTGASGSFCLRGFRRSLVLYYCTKSCKGLNRLHTPATAQQSSRGTSLCALLYQGVGVTGRLLLLCVKSAVGPWKLRAQLVSYI